MTVDNFSVFRLLFPFYPRPGIGGNRARPGQWGMGERPTERRQRR